MTTISHLRKWKQQQRKFASITAYDAAFARLFAEQGINGDAGGRFSGHDHAGP